MSARKDMIWYSAGVILGQWVAFYYIKTSEISQIKLDLTENLKRGKRVWKGFSSRDSRSLDSNLNSSVQSFHWH